MYCTYRVVGVGGDFLFLKIHKCNWCKFYSDKYKALCWSETLPAIVRNVLNTNYSQGARIQITP